VNSRRRVLCRDLLGFPIPTEAVKGNCGMGAGCRLTGEPCAERVTSLT
jgi:hypothetical protein